MATSDPRPMRQRAADDVHSTPRDADPLRILLAEDNPANRAIVMHMLANEGCHTRVAKNGREALDLIQQYDFDLVLMDVQMPVLDGFQATAAIRALPNPRQAELPIVAMTASDTLDDQQQCLDAGMDGYLAKPIGSQDLIALVRRLTARPGAAATSQQSTLAAAGGTAPSAPPPVAGDAFDLSAALDRADGHYDRFQGIVEFFFGDFPPLIERIRSALERQDGAAVAAAAHRLAGTIVYLNAAPALAAVQAVGAAARTGDWQQTTNLLAHCERDLRQLSQALAPHRPAASSQTADDGKT